MLQIVKFYLFAGHRKDYTLTNIDDAVGSALQVMDWTVSWPQASIN